MVILTAPKGKVFQEFLTDDPRTDTPVRISSREQYKRFLESRGLHCEGYTKLLGDQEHSGELEEKKRDKERLREKLNWARKKVAEDRAITVRT